MFTLIEANDEWLKPPLALWNENPIYLEMCCIVQDLTVVKDAAEQCVNDVEVYANATNAGIFSGI